VEVFKVVVGSEAVGERLDRYLAGQLKEMSRSRIQALINDGKVFVNNKGVKSNYKLREQDRIEVNVPKPEQLEVKAQAIKLDILFEDEDIIVVNKPQGMVVHPAAGNYEGTLVNALLHHCKDLSGINGVLRPGIVHRIDKDTSGILVAAKNDFAHRRLARQLKEHTVKRIYYALVHGVVQEPAGIIEAPIGRDPKDRKRMAVIYTGKEAITKYWVIETFRNYSFLKLQLKTGRTHQIRVHMSYLGHPVVGDPKYGPTKSHFNLEGQALHAATLGFNHPRSGEYMEFNAPLPDTIQLILHKLRKELHI
jgi:23S rRNA pseudouridine1911/1915/1917 synthase